MSELNSGIPVYIIWLDACSGEDWIDLAEAVKEPLAEIHSVGFLMHKNQDRVLLALNIDQTNAKVSQYIAIPQRWISTIVELRSDQQPRA